MSNSEHFKSQAYAAIELIESELKGLTKKDKARLKSQLINIRCDVPVLDLWCEMPQIQCITEKLEAASEMLPKSCAVTRGKVAEHIKAMS